MFAPISTTQRCVKVPVARWLLNGRRILRFSEPELFARRLRSPGCRLPSAGATFPRDGFQYLNPEAAERLERELQETREQGLQEYQDLKDLLLKRTWRFGTLFALYLLLTTSGEVAFCELLGAGASYVYLLWLIKDVDALQPGDTMYMQEAEKMQPQMMQNVAKWLASYRHALQPRLLILVGLMAGIAAYNAAFPEQPLSLVQEGCLVAGFLSYKVALLQKIYDDLKPRALTAEELMQQPRPMLAAVEDVELPWKKKSGEKGGEGSTGGEDSAASGAAEEEK